MIYNFLLETDNLLRGCAKMDALQYDNFVELVKKYKILPFAGFIPDYPSLTAAATNNHWHTDSETDPWLWRIQIVQDGVAAYGKFFGDKLCFIHSDLFPVVKTILTSDQTIDERYKAGLVSRTAYHLYTVLLEHGNIDSRNLRKMAGLSAKEDKKEYEKSLVELQNNGDVVITGAKKPNDNELAWSSMCYQPSDLWIHSIQQKENLNLSLVEAKNLLTTELAKTCSEKSYKYFVKRLQLDINKPSL